MRGVRKPARYTGGELNSINKGPEFFLLDEKDRVHFALCFPDLYEIAMSNQAIQVLYAILNGDEKTFCERCFAPDLDMRDFLRKKGLPLTSLESSTPLCDFDMVGISLHYELAYTSMLEMLDLGGVPLEAERRGEEDPLVIGGGPIACNLEPVAPFFDLIVLGDGEEVLPQIIEKLKIKKKTGQEKKDFLLSLSGMPGLYIPSHYRVDYLPNGRVRSLEGTDPSVPLPVPKALVRDLDRAFMPTRPIVPSLEAVHDRMVMEVLRGCARGCRFCQAGFTYRPLRERSQAQLLESADQLIRQTGYEEMGLLSLSTSDYTDLEDLVRALLPMTEPCHINLSLPSLRLDSFDFELAREIAKSRRAGLTFAPEAGSQRLRDVINKNITEKDMLDAAKVAFTNGWDRLKLYFMLGLPTETEEDLDGIIDLVEKLLALWDSLPREGSSKGLRVTVSCAFFIPKPFTPFQWAGQASLEEMRAKQARLASGLRDRRVSFNWHDFQSSVLEGVLSRGDRRLAPVIREAWQKGAYLEAWHEHFNFELWEEGLRRIEGGAAFYNRERGEDELFPWDHLDVSVKKDFLRREWKKARAGTPTPSCYELCSACGCQHYRTGVCPGGNLYGRDR